jgi:hypothetical protein
MSYSLAIVCDKCKEWVQGVMVGSSYIGFGIGTKDEEGINNVLEFIKEHEGCQKEGMRIIVLDPYLPENYKEFSGVK